MNTLRRARSCIAAAVICCSATRDICPDRQQTPRIRFTTEKKMSLESDVRYLMDRIKIQDVIARYGLGQDFHQPMFDDFNMMEHWSKVFTKDATIDYSDVGFPPSITPEQLVAIMRGRDGQGGMVASFTVWQHLEAHATVTV